MSADRGQGLEGERTYGGLAASERRDARRERLVRAGMDLLGSDGASAATVTEACRRAGLTPRYFYESFADREALLIAVLETVAADVERTVMSAYGEAAHDAPVKALAAIDALVRLVTEDPRYARILFAESLTSPALAERRRQSLRGFGRLLAEQARIFYDAPADAHRGIDLAGLMLVGGLAEAVMAWLAGELEISRSELIADSAELFVATVEAAIELTGVGGEG